MGNTSSTFTYEEKEIPYTELFKKWLEKKCWEEEQETGTNRVYRYQAVYQTIDGEAEGNEISLNLDELELNTGNFGGASGSSLSDYEKRILIRMLLYKGVASQLGKITRTNYDQQIEQLKQTENGTEDKEGTAQFPLQTPAQVQALIQKLKQEKTQLQTNLAHSQQTNQQLQTHYQTRKKQVLIFGFLALAIILYGLNHKEN